MSKFKLQVNAAGAHGSLLADAIAQRGLSRAAFAKLLGCSDVYVLKVERGLAYLSDEKIHRAAEILGIDWVRLWKSTNRNQITLSTVDILESRQKLEELATALKEAA